MISVGKIVADLQSMGPIDPDPCAVAAAAAVGYLITDNPDITEVRDLHRSAAYGSIGCTLHVISLDNLVDHAPCLGIKAACIICTDACSALSGAGSIVLARIIDPVLSDRRVSGPVHRISAQRIARSSADPDPGAFINQVADNQAMRPMLIAYARCVMVVDRDRLKALVVKENGISIVIIPQVIPLVAVSHIIDNDRVRVILDIGVAKIELPIMLCLYPRR